MKFQLNLGQRGGNYLKQSKDIFIIRHNCNYLFCYFKVSLILFHYYKSMILVNVFSDLLRLQIISYSGSFFSGMQIYVLWSFLLFSCHDKLTSAQDILFFFFSFLQAEMQGGPARRQPYQVLFQYQPSLSGSVLCSCQRWQ